MSKALWGVIGGSGFYELFDADENEGTDQQERAVDTPYGLSSGPITIGLIGGHPVAFLPRHGRDHRYIAHRVPYRANMWTLHSLGVERVLAPASVGSLQPDLHPGQMVIVDQLIDRTRGRADTYHDADGDVHHQTFADPYDAQLRARLLDAGHRSDLDVVDGGTMVVINGPRFSTRAESVWFRQMGWHVVNMTGYPEAVLAAELGLRYASVALVTDYDAGVDGHEPVTMEAVFAMMRRNAANVRRLITATIAG